MNRSIAFCLLMLCSLGIEISSAAIRCRRTTPVLHSIFDTVQTGDIELRSASSETAVDAIATFPGLRGKPRRPRTCQQKYQAFVAMAVLGGVMANLGAVGIIAAGNEGKYTLEDNGGLGLLFSFVTTALLVGGVTMIIIGIIKAGHYKKCWKGS